MKQNVTFLIIFLLCLLLWACSSSSAAAESAPPAEPEASSERVSVEMPRLTKEEMLDLSLRMAQTTIERSLADKNYANSLIGTVYTFDGIICSLEADHAAVQFSINTIDGPFEPGADTIAAEVYLSPEELHSIEPLQKVCFVGKLDEVKTAAEKNFRMVFYSAAIVKDRLEDCGTISEQNTEYAPNTWNLISKNGEVRAITFSGNVDILKGAYIPYSYKLVDGRRVDAYPVDHAGSPLAYDPILLNFPDMIEMGEPKLSLEEIRSMLEQNLSLDEVADKIDTLADLIQYLHQRGFVFGNRDIHFRSRRYRWSVSHSAKNVFNENMGDCGGGSNLVNYILRGDFDEQGYIQESHTDGGHIYNYFKQDGLYYFFDLSYSTCTEYQDHYLIVTDDPQKFSDRHIYDRNHYVSIKAPNYILLLCMYPQDGERLPMGYGNINKSKLGFKYFPEQYQNDIRILYLEESIEEEPAFVKAPEQSTWPKKAR